MWPFKKVVEEAPKPECEHKWGKYSETFQARKDIHGWRRTAEKVEYTVVHVACDAQDRTCEKCGLVQRVVLSTYK